MANWPFPKRSIKGRKMRKRTPYQLARIEELRSFWANRKAGVLKPTHNELNPDGAVELRWHQYQQGDEQVNTHLAAMLDWAADHEIPHRWVRQDRLRQWRHVVKARGCRGYSSAGKVILELIVPTGLQSEQPLEGAF